MTKKISPSYALLGMILAISACNKDDNGPDDHKHGGRIEFNASLPEVTTRASEVQTLTEIQISAFTVGASSETPYFVNKEFSKNSNTGKFVCYDAECIWPNNNDELRFTAFAPSCDDMKNAGGDATSTGDQLTSFKVAKDIANQFDFVTAMASGRLLDHEETGITLKFRHQLSRIRINAYGNSSSYDLEIAGVRLGGVASGGDFDLSAKSIDSDGNYAGVWKSISKGSVEYIYREGDVIVTLDKTDASPLTSEKAVSIMGSKIGGENGYENSAMIVPSNNSVWDYKENAANGDNHADGMYLSVLVRVKDTTPYDTNGSIIYPLVDDASSDESVFLAVDKEDGKTVKTRLYKQGDNYFTDADHTVAYDLSANNAEVKVFGWAALPVAGDLQPGLVYSYTLNYSNGVGLRDPSDSRPAEPIISDKVLVDVEVAQWQEGAKTNVDVPRK